MIYTSFFLFFNVTATTEIYTTRHTLSLHDGLPICRRLPGDARGGGDRASVHPDLLQRSEEHTSELQSRLVISYAVFCLKKKQKNIQREILTEQCYATNTSPLERNS